jgi:hypothetical protein
VANVTDTMLIEGVEHAAYAYNDDTGHGLTVCGQPIGPGDVGPRAEPVTCKACLEKLQCAPS